MKKITIDTDNPEFQDAFNLVQHTSQSVFLTGKAGTGKSTFLRYICQYTKKKYVVLAPTGVAAINAEGSTIHSFFKMPFRPMLPDDPDLSLNDNRIYEFLKYNKSHRKLIKEVELIIVDEISMVRADMIDFMDRVLRVYSGNMRQPFGGKQLLFVGDIFQLEPVVTPDTKQILTRFYPNSFFFSARVFKEISLVPIELKKVYRQTDQVFISLLDRIRNNQVLKQDIDQINQRYNSDYNSVSDEFSITLATRRDQVDFINEKHLAALSTDTVVFKGEIHGDFPENSLPTQKDLVLKEGAQVIFIKNDQQRRWVNGTIGLISEIDKEFGLRVLLENGNEIQVEKDLWSNRRYKYNEKEGCIEEEEIGTFIQYPIRLAWAITVHKSQGLTFNHVVIDFAGGAFAGGQTYVALSRCTSLEGIVLKHPLSRNDIFVRPEIITFSKQFNNKQLIDRALSFAQTDKLYLQSLNEFRRGEMRQATQTFAQAISQRNDLNNPLVVRFIARELIKGDALKSENKNLIARLNEQQERMRKYAQEYYLMGNECILKAKDARSALANFDKAIEMDPTHLDAWIRKGITHFDQGDLVEAGACFNKAVELSPLSFKARYNRGKLRYTQGFYDTALTDMLKAVQLRPSNPTAHDRLGDIYFQLGKEKFALKHKAKAESLRKK